MSAADEVVSKMRSLRTGLGMIYYNDVGLEFDSLPVHVLLSFYSVTSIMIIYDV
jgi:hypothetical protein